MRVGRLLASKLAKRRVWRRLALERLTEPLHLNLLSVFILAFGSFRARVAWDLVPRPAYAYGVLKAAESARLRGLPGVSIIELGVASGAGLLNLAALADEATRVTGVRCTVHGFDTGAGMPPAVDYRDHPDLYQEGDFGMDAEALRKSLPGNARLHLGPLEQTIPAFVESLDPREPLGFVALDVDYYSSSVDALQVLTGESECYLPLVVLYADDVTLEHHTSAGGELLAFAEFTAAHPMRPIERPAYLEPTRIFSRAGWLRQIFSVHILDHPVRSTVRAASTKRYIENPYLPGERGRERFSIDPAEDS